MLTQGSTDVHLTQVLIVSCMHSVEFERTYWGLVVSKRITPALAFFPAACLAVNRAFLHGIAFFSQKEKRWNRPDAALFAPWPLNFRCIVASLKFSLSSWFR